MHTPAKFESHMKNNGLQKYLLGFNGALTVTYTTVQLTREIGTKVSHLSTPINGAIPLIETGKK